MLSNKKPESVLIQSKEIWSSDTLNINWCEKSFKHEQKIQFDVKDEFIKFYFQLKGASKSFVNGRKVVMRPNSQGVFHMKNSSCRQEQYNDDSNLFTFFEIKLHPIAITQIFSTDLQEELSLIQKLGLENGFICSQKPITPQMRCIICNMCNCPFNGKMKKTYLELKIAELFILQVGSYKPIKNSGFRKHEIDKLITIKEFIDKNYRERIRIIDLAKIAGTNQQLLKTGFRKLFGTTIFGYYNSLRMERAKYLLSEKDKCVAEVADEMGYKNPQHFTVAFKKKFGVLPRDLKRKSLVF
jgi:AraC-like DNA-binding protein